MDCRPGDFLSMDVEQDLMRLFLAEIELHRETETLKQHLETCLDYDQEACYNTVDCQSIGYIDVKALDNFFRRTFTKGITVEDNVAIIRRIDLDCDGKLRLEEFNKGIQAQEPFSKMLIRNKMKR